MSRIFKNAFIFIVGIATLGLFQAVNADWTPSEDTDNDIVISLQTNPMADAERACLAVTFARMLSGSTNVTLFVTLDGVSLADKSVIRRSRFKCETPWEEQISLKESLELFLDGNDNNLVVCPLCWNARYDELPDYGVIGPMVGPLFIGAEKVIDF